MMPNRSLVNTAFGVAAFALTACTSGNVDGDFLCEAQAGSPCTTIAAVDGTGTGIHRSLSERAEDSQIKSLSQDPLLGGKGGSGGPGDGGFPYNAAAYRKAEVVGTLWIAPILDRDEVFHEARFVHFVIRQGRWNN